MVLTNAKAHDNIATRLIESDTSNVTSTGRKTMQSRIELEIETIHERLRVERAAAAKK